jgi:hypothetical protein
MLLLIAGLAQAQVPAKINYQGLLTDPNGAPTTGTVSMIFSIYTAATGGSPLYTETQSVAVTNGVFNVALGANTPLTLPFDVPYFLGIAVSPDSVEMTPRQPLLSGAYARRVRPR